MVKRDSLPKNEIWVKYYFYRYTNKLFYSGRENSVCCDLRKHMQIEEANCKLRKHLHQLCCTSHMCCKYSQPNQVQKLTANTCNTTNYHYHLCNHTCTNTMVKLLICSTLSSLGHRRFICQVFSSPNSCCSDFISTPRVWLEQHKVIK